MNCTEMTRAELLKMGFRKWNETSRYLLIPKDHLDNIPDGTELHCIDGKVYVKGFDYIDDDTRNGLLAYGIIPKGEY